MDHPDTYPMDVDGENTAVNCLYHGALNAAAALAREMLDDEPQAAEWEGRAKEVKAAIRKHLWSEKDRALNMTLSHAWTSGPTALLPEKVLGIEPVSPGWSQFTIRPALHGLEWASGVVPSPAGPIRVKANRDGMGMKIDVAIPEGTRAWVSIPVPSLRAAKVSVNARTIWESGKELDLPTGIRFHSASEKSIIFEFPPGSYQISSGTP